MIKVSFVKPFESAHEDPCRRAYKKILTNRIDKNTRMRKRSILSIHRNKRSPRYNTRKMRKIIGKEYQRRIRLILKSSLSPMTKTKATNQLAVPVFQYGCAIIKLPQLEINNLDAKTRKLPTIHKMFDKNQGIPRLYLPRRERGGCVMEHNQVHRTSCVRPAEQVKSSTDYRTRFVHDQDNNKPEKGSLFHFATNFKKTGVNDG